MIQKTDFEIFCDGRCLLQHKQTWRVLRRIELCKLSGLRALSFLRRWHVKEISTDFIGGHLNMGSFNHPTVKKLWSPCRRNMGVWGFRCLRVQVFRCSGVSLLKCFEV